MDQLSLDLLKLIFNQMEDHTLSQSLCVCQSWYQLSKQDLFWKNRLYGRAPNVDWSFYKKGTWYKYYLDMSRIIFKVDYTITHKPEDAHYMVLAPFEEHCTYSISLLDFTNLYPTIKCPHLRFALKNHIYSRTIPELSTILKTF